MNKFSFSGKSNSLCDIFKAKGSHNFWCRKFLNHSFDVENTQSKLCWKKCIKVEHGMQFWISESQWKRKTNNLPNYIHKHIAFVQSWEAAPLNLSNKLTSSCWKRTKRRALCIEFTIENILVKVETERRQKGRKVHC